MGVLYVHVCVCACVSVCLLTIHCTVCVLVCENICMCTCVYLPICSTDMCVGIRAIRNMYANTAGMHTHIHV